MSLFLKNICLYGNLILELNINRRELVHRLSKIIYQTNTSFISLVQDSNIPTRFEYRGMIDDNHFTIKRRRRFFDINLNYPVMKGKFSGQHEITSVSLEFTPSVLQIFTLIFTLFFFLLSVMINLMNNGQDLLFIAFSSLLFGSQYFVLKREINIGKYDFERELIYITQKKYTSINQRLELSREN